jgi:hypothetical protein
LQFKFILKRYNKQFKKNLYEIIYIIIC